MRFAIALLCLIAIASVIGTVLPQNEPQAVYINQFGPFWATLFDYLGLYTVYSSLWFLVILLFLVCSTSICLLRTIPKIWADLRDWKLSLQMSSLAALQYHQVYTSPLPRARLTETVSALLAQQSYGFRVQQHTQHTLISARTGRANKLGYIATHAAVIIICLGALLDSDIWLKMQLFTGAKKAFFDQAQSLLLRDIPAENRLASSTPSFQAHLFLPEGQSSQAALIQVREGTLVQDLPFSLTLKQFNVAYYPTGMPKLFASDVVLTDLESGQTLTRTISVNHPLIYKGIAIYQSSFADGGSLLELAGYPMRGQHAAPFPLSTAVGQQRAIHVGQDTYALELSDFRAINVESVTASTKPSESAIAPPPNKINTFLGAAVNPPSDTLLRNLGPSIQYRLRDHAGQAKEFHNYMLPVTIDDIPVFLVGIRDMSNEPFHYLRIPADAQGSLQEWMALRAALQNRQMRVTAAARYAQNYSPPSNTQAQAVQSAARSHQPIQPVQQIALHLLDHFAAAAEQAPLANNSRGGFAGIAQLIEATVPANAQSRTAEIFMHILQGSLYELWQLTRAHLNLPTATRSPEYLDFLHSAINALSDSFLYPAPVLMQIQQFKEIKGSVFQLRRMPGKKIVYSGCLLLVIGIVLMFYLNTHRVWILLQDQEAPGCQIRFAAHSQRQTIRFAQTVSFLKSTLQTVTQAVPIS